MISLRWRSMLLGEWPQEQQSNEIPNEINIWFHKGRGYDEEEE